MFSKKFLVCLILSLISVKIGFSQNLLVFLKANKAHYSMSEDLNNIQKDILSKFYALDFKITDDFPSSYNYQIILNLINFWDLDKNLSTGLFFDIASTAGRIHYADYSGEFETIQKISRWQLGIHIAKDFAPNSKFSLIPSFQVSYMKTKLDEKYTLDLSNIFEAHNKISYKSSFAFEPGLNLQYKFNSILIQFSTSYQLDLEGSHFFEYKSINYTYSFKPNWSGFRYGLGIGYILF